MPKVKILIVDDNDGVLDVLSQMVKVLGGGMYEITTETNPIKALELFKEAEKEAGFDLLITDFNMLGMNGARLIQESFLCKKRPFNVIVASGNVDEAKETVKALFGENEESSFVFYLEKPANLLSIKEVLLDSISRETYNP